MTTTDPNSTPTTSSSSQPSSSSSSSLPPSKSPPSQNHSTTYHQLRQTLLSPQTHSFHLPSTSASRLILPQQSHSQPQTTTTSPSSLQFPTISSLSLHPTLESLLHILNHDLPSAHFLLRHAENSPAWESMYTHGILHRIEGDIDNARAWYGDVQGSEVFTCVWGEDENDTRYKEFLNRSEKWRDMVCGRLKKKKETEEEGGMDWEKEEKELREWSLWEVEKVLGFCERRFGIGVVGDARSEYNSTEGHKSEIAKRMIVGGEGWREF